MKNVKRNLTPEQSVLFSLLQRTLHGNGGEIETDFVVWTKLYALSAGQGLLAMIYNAVMTLPAESRPERELLVKWGLNTMGLEDRYAKQRTALRELVSLYDSNGIRTVLLKGAGLSENYPIPSHRECGDIDIFMYDQFERANQVISNSGIVIDRFMLKHSNFDFMGVPIENHFELLEPDEGYANYAFDKYLMSIIDKYPQTTINIDGVVVNVGNPLFSAVHIMCHAITHFQSWGIVVRHFCDWGTFLSKNRDKIDIEEFRAVMSANGYMKLTDTFTYICVEYLGFEFDRQLYPLADPRLAEKIVADTFAYIDHPERDRITLMQKLKVIYVGTIHLLSSKWKFDTTSRCGFYNKFGVSFRIGVKSLMGK